jgi:hypothetical protein
VKQRNDNIAYIGIEIIWTGRSCSSTEAISGADNASKNESYQKRLDTVMRAAEMQEEMICASGTCIAGKQLFGFAVPRNNSP